MEKLVEAKVTIKGGNEAVFFVENGHLVAVNKGGMKFKVEDVFSPKNTVYFLFEGETVELEIPDHVEFAKIKAMFNSLLKEGRQVYTCESWEAMDAFRDENVTNPKVGSIWNCKDQYFVYIYDEAQ